MPKFTKFSMPEIEARAEALDRALPAPRVRIVLENVRSGHNVGSIFRTADALGVAGVTLCGITPYPPDRQVEKTALGATRSVPWEYAPTSTSALQALRTSGHRIIAVEQTDLACSLGSTRLDGRPVALLFGNELRGISNEALSLVDECLLIPQRGAKHSLNVAVCAGIVLWEMNRGILLSNTHSN